MILKADVQIKEEHNNRINTWNDWWQKARDFADRGEIDIDAICCSKGKTGLNNWLLDVDKYKGIAFALETNIK